MVPLRSRWPRGYDRETVSWPACSKRDSTTSPAPRPSFRLVEPVGVLEATRAGEVVATLEAAEAAAGRGLWVAGFVTYEAAPGLDPDLVVRDRDADDPFAALPLAWFAMFERAEETTLPLPRDEGVAAAPEGTWMPTTTARAVRVLRRPDPGADRGRRDLPGQPHDAPALPRGRRPARALPRPLLRAAGRVLRLPRPRAVPRALRLAGAVLRAPRRRDRDQADEGHRAARPVARGGSRRRGASPRLGEGSRRERDDRRPPSERPRPDQPDRLGHLGGRLPGRAIRDRLAADDDRVGGARSRAWIWPSVFRGLFPSGSVTGAPEGPDDGDHPTSSRTRLEAIYCGAVGYLAPEGSGHPDARFNVAIRTVTVDTASTYRRVRGRRRHHVGLRGRAPSTRRRSRSLVSSRRVAPASSSWRRCGHDLAEGVRHLDRHLRRLAGVRRLLRLPVRRDRGPGGRREGGRVRAARHRAASGSSLAQGRHGAGGVHAARERARRRSRRAR